MRFYDKFTGLTSYTYPDLPPEQAEKLIVKGHDPHVGFENENYLYRIVHVTLYFRRLLFVSG